MLIYDVNLGVHGRKWNQINWIYYPVLTTYSAIMLMLKIHKRISNKIDFKTELVSVIVTALKDTSAKPFCILTNNNLGLLVKLCFWVLCAVLCSERFFFPKSQGILGKNSDLL